MPALPSNTLTTRQVMTEERELAMKHCGLINVALYNSYDGWSCGDVSLHGSVCGSHFGGERKEIKLGGGGKENILPVQYSITL